MSGESSESKNILLSQLPYLLMISVVIFWGLSWPVGRIVSQEFDSNVFTAAFIRFTVALPFLILFTYLMEGSLSVPRRFHKKIMLLGFLQITLYNFLYLSGLRFTSASDASLIIAINPTLTALFASQVYQDEALSIKRISGLVMAFLGVFLIFIESPNTQVPNRVLGNLIIFAGALVWALYTTFSRPIYDKISPLKFQVWATFYGWIFLGLISLLEKPWEQSYTSRGIFSLVYLGLFAAALSNTFFSYGVKKIGPTQTSIFVNFVPVIGIFFSILILSEAFSFLYIISFVLIFIGVYTVNRS